MLTFNTNKAIPKLDVLFICTPLWENSLIVGPCQLQFLASCGAIKIVLILEEVFDKSTYSAEQLATHFTEITKLPTNFVLVYPGQSFSCQNFNFINYCPSTRPIPETNIALVDYKWLYPNLKLRTNGIKLILEPKKAADDKIKIL